MIRLFTAIELPDDVRDGLLRLQQGLPGARWSPPPNMHITLCFMGEVPEPQAVEMAQVLDGIKVPPFTLSLTGLGTFGGERQKERARILYAGVEHDGALPRLAQKIETAARRLGIAVDNRKYFPHVTLARLKDTPADRIGNYIRRHNLYRSAPVTIRQFTLFESLLSHTGSIYQPLETYDLAPAEGSGPV